MTHDNLFLTVLILFVGGTLYSIVKDIRKPNVRLTFHGLLPFIMGMILAFLGREFYQKGEVSGMIFVSVLGLSALYRTAIRSEKPAIEDTEGS